MNVPVQVSPQTLECSYLSFRLEEETFAVKVDSVLEILEIPPITQVPKSPDFMRGVINLRGSVLPVIDTRLKFSLPRTATTVDSCIVVLRIEIAPREFTVVGALVDSVQEVLEIRAEQIQPCPQTVCHYQSEFITGMVRLGERYLMILQVDSVFSAEELDLSPHTDPS